MLTSHLPWYNYRMTEEEIDKEFQRHYAKHCRLCRKGFPATLYPVGDSWDGPGPYEWVHLVAAVEQHKIHHPDKAGTSGEWKYNRQVLDGAQSYVECEAYALRALRKSLSKKESA